MITLALDTSTAIGAVALLRDEKPLVEETFRRDISPHGADQHLFGTIQKVLGAQQLVARDVDLMAVGTGPGSFTGIRVSIAAAKGLALPHSRPIKSASSFDALALTALPQMPRDCLQMCVFCDARRDEIYFAIYDRDGRRTHDCRIGELELIADEIHNPMWFVSAEIEKFKDAIGKTFGGFATICPMPIYPSAAAVGWLAIGKFMTDGRQGDMNIEPIYLRIPVYKKL